MTNVDPNLVAGAIIALASLFVGFSLSYIGRLFGQLLVVHRTRAADKLARSRQGIAQVSKQTGSMPVVP